MNKATPAKNYAMGRPLHQVVRSLQVYQVLSGASFLIEPATMGAAEMTAFLTHPAVQGQVTASPQSQALRALLFLYRDVLQMALNESIALVRTKKPSRLPTLLTKAEVQAVLRHLAGEYLLMAQVLYGSGLRLMECVRLRVAAALRFSKSTILSFFIEVLTFPS